MARIPGGSGGGDGATAPTFVDGTTLKVRLLVTTLFGAVVLEWWYGMIEFFEDVAETATRLVTAPLSGYAEFISIYATIPETTITTSFETAAAFITSTGEALGPFAFPLAALLTAVLMVIADWGVRNARVI